LQTYSQNMIVLTCNSQLYQNNDRISTPPWTKNGLPGHCSIEPATKHRSLFRHQGSFVDALQAVAGTSRVREWVTSWPELVPTRAWGRFST